LDSCLSDGHGEQVPFFNSISVSIITW
jgi:hypothetical protein